MNIFSALTSKIFGGLSAALALALAWLYVSTSATIASYDKAINAPVKGWSARFSACTADIATARGNAATLAAQIDRQNDTVQALSDAAAARYSSGALGRSIAAQTNGRATAATAKLGKAKAGENVCASADSLILETVK